MKLRCLKGKYAGEVREYPARLARQLVERGVCEPVERVAEPTPTAPPAAEKKPRRRRRKKKG